MHKIRVLVVDDSVFLCRSLPRVLESDPSIEVVGTAGDGAEGLQKVRDLRPDVVILDLIMPVMDGLTALKHIMREVPTPVVILSATTHEGTRETMEALSMGAVDFVTKPSGPVSLDIYTVRAELVGKVKAAYASKAGVTDAGVTRDRFQAIIKRLSQEGTVPAGEMPLRPGTASGKRLVAIAASTGGPLALQHVLTRLPGNLNAGVVIVLHISAGFTRPLAERLNGLSPLAVREAKDGMPIVPGIALVSPTGVHLTVERSLSGPGRGTEAGLTARLGPEPADALHRPSADVLFHSIALCCPTETCAIILTGMGDDGALGLRAIRQGGGYTIAQDEATSVVYGMPRRAVDLGGVDVSLPIEQIAGEIARVTAVRQFRDR